ncbi:MAG: phosphoheptose isomerase [Candidatus Methanofastidiosa archaeon]|nr:phosphoheptose isomerase [Candidatus Methanofastidiosa archaeon]
MSFLRENIGPDGKKTSPKLVDGLKNFIIDIDGVICDDIPNEEPERMITAKEIPKAKETINKWYEEGHIITFFTSRTENERKITENWLKEHGFKYHNIIFGKPRGGNYHYIDDKDIRATRFEGKFGEFVKKNKEIQVFE